MYKFSTTLLLSLCLIFLSNQARSQKTLTVSNGQQLIDAIGSNRTIVLQPGVYAMSEVEAGGNPNIAVVEAYDGFEVHVNGVKNLTIKCTKKEKAELVTKPQYGHVLTFTNCENLTIENIIAGHGPEKGNCEGGVLLFNTCRNVTISGSVLYGSGTEGITGNNLTNLNVKGTTIKECTYSILSLNESGNVTFEDCFFKENKEFDLVNLSQVTGIRFRNCTFKDNFAGDFSGHLFNLNTEDEVLLENCTFTGNDVDFLSNTGENLRFRDCDFSSNKFRKGRFEN